MSASMKSTGLVAWLCAAALCSLSAQAATFTVTNGNDSGSGSLRAAILAANADASGTTASPHIIAFSGVAQVTLSSPLPVLNRPAYVNVLGSEVRIRATTLVSGDGLRIGAGAVGSVVQNLAVVCTSPMPCFSGAGIVVFDSSSTVETLLDRITVDGVGGSGIDVGGTVLIDRSVVVRSGQGTGAPGIACSGSIALGSNDRLRVIRSRIGIDAAGASAGNALDGIAINGCVARIGGAADTEGNVISANGGRGIHLSRADGSLIQGNLIGLDANGGSARGNDSTGISVDRSRDLLIGGEDAALANTIAGNAAANVYIQGTEPAFRSDARIRRNRIGTRRDGLPLPPGANRAAVGIEVVGWAKASIGGGEHGNLIRDHSLSGVRMISPGGAGAAGEAMINRNSIHANGTAIIDQGSQPVPQLSPIGGTSVISGSVPGGASGGLVEFYVDDWGQSRLYVGETDALTPNGAGGVAFTTTIGLAAHTGKRLTAIYRGPPSFGFGRSGALSTPVPIGTRILSVSVSGAQGAERVDSTPLVLECPGFCTAGFSGGTVTLNAYPGTNRVVTWSGDCSGTGSCSLSMTQNRSVLATFGPAQRRLTVNRTGPGTVASNPPGIQCGSQCSADYNHGVTVQLVATPTADHQFGGWTGACSGFGACAVTMTQARTVGASFTPIMRQIDVTRTGLGTVVSTPAGINCGSSCTASFAQGTTVLLDATPAAGWQFASWTACPNPLGARCTVVVPAQDSSIRANFTALPPNTHPLTVTRVGGGSVVSSPSGISCGSTCTAAFNEGATVTLTATPASTWSFQGWSGACAGTGTCTVSMTQAQAVTATFVPPNFPLTVNRIGQGAVLSTPSGIDCGSTCIHAFPQATVVTLTAIPAPGWRLENFTGACLGQSCEVTMSEPKSVNAIFGLVPPTQRTLDVERIGNGSVGSTPAGIDCGTICSASFDEGTIVSLLATPASGWQFVAWGGACEGSDTCQVTLSEHRQVSATFAIVPPQSHVLTIARTGQGEVASAPAGIGCGDICSASYPHGTTVSLTATPAPGWYFAGWHTACVGTGACSVAMTEARTVGARFIRDVIFGADFE